MQRESPDSGKLQGFVPGLDKSTRRLSASSKKWIRSKTLEYAK